MIEVEYYPVFLIASPLPNKEKEYIFQTYEEFKEWVQSYVCVNCLLDFELFTCRQPKTIHDWLEMGCGCEIGIADPDNIIQWEDEMIYTQEYLDYREEHMEEIQKEMENSVFRND